MENHLPELVLGILAAIVLAVILIRLGRQIAIFLLVAGGIAAVVVVGLAIFSQAEANRQTARAVTVASAGQTAASVSVVVLTTLLIVVLVIGGLTVVYLGWRIRRAERLVRHQFRQWHSDPNALWGHRGQVPQVPAQPYYPYPPTPASYPVYSSPVGYTPPSSVYPGYTPPPQVVMIYDNGQAELAEDPLGTLPLWEDDETEGW